MIRLICRLCMAAGLLWTVAANAQTARVVSSCATGVSPVLDAGSAAALTVDTSGRLCSGSIAAATGGATPYTLIAAATNNATALKASAGTVYSVQVFGIGAAPAYLKFYDKATSPTCASDTIVTQIMIPAASTAANGAGALVSLPVGKNFTTGIAFCVVTGIAANDNTAVAAATFVINIDYK